MLPTRDGPMSWNDIAEIVKVLGAVATAAAAWFAATTAYRGLEKWRSETFGKRRAELAATVLTKVYEAEEIFRAAREPFVLAHEMAKKEGIPDVIAEDSSFAPERRLLGYQEFFGRFRSMKHEFAAIFGREAAKSLDELWRIRIEINHAVDNMLRNKEVPEVSGSRGPSTLGAMVPHSIQTSRSRQR
jgi:hypothetical protein